jgi:hypothetical protein
LVNKRSLEMDILKFVGNVAPKEEIDCPDGKLSKK